MRRVSRLAAWSVGAALALAACAPGALAAPLQVDRFVGLPLPDGVGQLSQGRSVGVNEATGQVYVVDAAANRVSRFDADGNFELSWGRGVLTGGSSAEVCTAADAPCAPGTDGTEAAMFDSPRSVAVNQGTGDLYVLDGGNRRVQQFALDDAGTPGDSSDDLPVFVRTWGWGVQDGTAAFQICTSGCQAGISGTGVGQVSSQSGAGNELAVSPVDGDVFLVQNRKVLRFDSDGTLDAEPVIGSAAVFGDFSPEVVAVDSQGIVYAAQSGRAASGAVIERYDSTGVHGAPGFLAPIGMPPLAVTPGSVQDTQGLVVDPDSDGAGPDVDRLYVARDAAVGDTVVQQFDSPGTLAAPIAVDETHGAGLFDDLWVSSLAVNGAAGRLYVGAGAESLGHVGGVGYYVLDGDGTSGSVVATVDTVVPGGHSVDVSGEVDPSPDGVLQYWFEHSSDGVEWTARPKRMVGGSGAEVVSDTIQGLQANAAYQVRLVARKVTGASTFVEEASTPEPFMTDVLPPEVETGGSQHVGATLAQVLATVNANNLPTSYHFEYGPDTSYGSQAPIPSGALTGGEVQTVFAQLTGLQPDTVYHYRIVADNGIEEGPGDTVVEGADRTFTTRAEVPAPPGRAFEMVTPADKNGRYGGKDSLENGFSAANPGVAARSGDAMLFILPRVVLDADAGTQFVSANHFTRLSRQPGVGWGVEALHTVPPYGSSAAPSDVIAAASGDFTVFSMWHRVSFFESQSRLTTLVLGDSGGLNETGWYDWVGDADQPPVETGNAGDAAVIDGERMLRWSEHLGLLGVGDPSLSQLSGRALYLQQPVGSGPRELVSECTAGTEIPELTGGGALDSQPCAPGTVTSRRGAVGASDNGQSTAARTMSEDGSRIFFSSPDPLADDVPAKAGSLPCAAGGPTGAATDCPPQLFVRQYDSGGTAIVRWVSAPETLGAPIALLGSGAIYEGASADGQHLFFRTDSPLTADDPNGGVASSVSDASWDLYRFTLAGDRDTDPMGPGAELTRISGGDGGIADVNTNSASLDATALRFLSDDGSRAYFVTRAPLPDAAADNTAPAGSSTTNVVDPAVTPASEDTRHLYLYDDSKTGAARWKFVARLPHDVEGVNGCASNNSQSGMSQTATGGAGFGPPDSLREIFNCVRGTSSGEIVAFETLAQLTADDSDEAGDIYRYDAATDELTRVSAPPPGSTPYSCHEDPSGATLEVCNADFGKISGGSARRANIGVTGLYHYNIAEDGRIYFESRLPLVLDAADGGLMDVFEWHNGELSLMSTGSDEDEAFYSGNGIDGETVFMWTTQRIDPREIEDADADIYAIRENGGFPPPPPPPVLCDVLADQCHGGGGAPIAAPVDSDTSVEGGNLPALGPAVVRVAKPSRKALRRAGRSGLLALRVRTTRPGRLVAVARARVRARGRRFVVRRVGAVRKAAPKAGRHLLRLRLNARARRTLRARGRLRVVVKVGQRGSRGRTMRIALRRAR